MAEPTGFPDLVTVLVNVGMVIPPLIMFLQGIAALMGLYFVASSLIEMWGVGNDNVMKYVSGRDRFSVAGSLIQALLGAVLLAMGTLEWMGVMSRTVTGGYANSRMLSYSDAGTTLAEQAQLATLALLGIMQVVGFIAMVKGWLNINRYYHAASNAGWGTSLAWMLGGIACWNFKWCSDVLNNTLGFDLIGMFTPFS